MMLGWKSFLVEGRVEKALCLFQTLGPLLAWGSTVLRGVLLAWGQSYWVLFAGDGVGKKWDVGVMEG